MGYQSSRWQSWRGITADVVPAGGLALCLVIRHVLTVGGQLGIQIGQPLGVDE